MSADTFRGGVESERRRYPRIPIKLEVQFKCVGKGKVYNSHVHWAEDLGAGGLALRSRRLLKVGQMLLVTLFLPPAGGREKRRIQEPVTAKNGVAVSVLSRVAWNSSRPDGSYLLGIQFLDLDRNERKLLKGFLVEYQLDSPDSPLYQ